MNDTKVLKLGVGISYKWYGFGVESQRLGLSLTAILQGFELCDWLLVIAKLKTPVYYQRLWFVLDYGAL